MFNGFVFVAMLSTVSDSVALCYCVIAALLQRASTQSEGLEAKSADASLQTIIVFKAFVYFLKGIHSQVSCVM